MNRWATEKLPCDRLSRCNYSQTPILYNSRLSDAERKDMQSRTLRIILTLFFIGLLATPFIVRRLSASKESIATTANASTALARYGLSFQEVAKASGVNFT